MAQISKFYDELQSIQDRFNQEIEELADEVRTEVILPICKRYKMTFFSGNGRFFFIDKKGGYIELAEDARGESRRAVGHALKLLNEEVARGQYLGYFVGDVEESKEEK
jgi:DNA-binding transcriptional ArsR family regulator